MTSVRRRVPRIEYYGHSLQLTRSKIFHEQLAVRAFPRVFSISPNRRFEPLALRHTGRHPVELPQLDSEVRGDSHEDAIRLGESF